MSTRPMMRLVERYLDHRRQLGFDLTSDGILLRNFARFADRTARGQPLTFELGLRWALLSEKHGRGYRARRMSVLRGLGRYAVAFDPRTDVMPKEQWRNPGKGRRSPHIYTAAQVRWLMRESRLLLPSTSPLRARTVKTIIGLLWCTGLRIGEAVGLRDRDFDARASTLRIAANKFSPERIIPIHATVVRALVLYQRHRRRLYPRSEHLFVSRSGQGGIALRTTVEFYFHWLASPLEPNGELPRVRLHDFRHSFASHWIARWSRQRAAVPHHLVSLARYLGHRNFSDTWWYVRANPTALQHAATTFQTYRQQPDPS